MILAELGLLYFRNYRFHDSFSGQTRSGGASTPRTISHYNETAAFCLHEIKTQGLRDSRHDFILNRDFSNFRALRLTAISCRVNRDGSVGFFRERGRDASDEFPRGFRRAGLRELPSRERMADACSE